MPKLNRIRPIEPELWQKIIGALEKIRKEFLHSFLAMLKKSQLSNRKKKLTCGFYLRIEEGEIYSEKNKSVLWVTRMLVDFDSENGAFDDSYYTFLAESDLCFAKGGGGRYRVRSISILCTTQIGARSRYICFTTVWAHVFCDFLWPFYSTVSIHFWNFGKLIS